MQGCVILSKIDQSKSLVCCWYTTIVGFNACSYGSLLILFLFFSLSLSSLDFSFFAKQSNTDTHTVNSAVSISTAMYNVSMRIAVNETVILPADRIPQSISGILLDWMRPCKDWRTIIVIAHKRKTPWSHQGTSHQVTVRPVSMFNP